MQSTEASNQRRATQEAASSENDEFFDCSDAVSARNTAIRRPQTQICMAIGN